MNKLPLIFSSVALALALFATLMVAVIADQQEQTITVLARLSNAVTSLQEQTQALKEAGNKLNSDEPTLSEKEVIAVVKSKWQPSYGSISSMSANYEGKGTWKITYIHNFTLPFGSSSRSSEALCYYEKTGTVGDGNPYYSCR